MIIHSAYDGVPSAIDRHVLTEILREEWGFEGFVESDSGAIANLCDLHFVCDSSFLDPEAAIKALTAGTDMEMGGRPVSIYYHIYSNKNNKLILNNLILYIDALSKYC